MLRTDQCTYLLTAHVTPFLSGLCGMVGCIDQLDGEPVTAGSVTGLSGFCCVKQHVWVGLIGHIAST